MACETIFDASFFPPSHPNDDPVFPPQSVLLDIYAYIDDRRNDTTADGFTSAKHPIQVTFWMAHPPRVSYFTVHCPGAELAQEPSVLRTEDGLVLLRVAFGPLSRINLQESHDFFVYQAEGRSLRLLPNPQHRKFSDQNVGLLRCTDGSFRVAALYPTFDLGKYNLHVFDSTTDAWSSKLVCVDLPKPYISSYRLASKVITLGEGGLMGWVDLWRGILLCDVLDDDPVPSYIRLPSPLLPNTELEGCPVSVRDIIVTKGCIKYFEIQMHIRPGSVIDGTFISNGWVAATWSRMLSSEEWSRDFELDVRDIEIENPKHLELLPKPTLVRLHTGLPALSLHDDGVVYLMAKVDRLDQKAWVLAVDMRYRTLQEVAEFDTKRALGFSFTYLQSWISKHLLGTESSTRYKGNADKRSKNGIAHAGNDKASKSNDNRWKGTVSKSKGNRVRK